jgi:nitrogen regulatory protein PII
MKEIRAYIKPFKLDAVMLGLSGIDGLSGMSYSKVEGFGRGRGSTGPTPLTGEDVRFVQQIRLEIVCGDELVDEILATILREAHTGLRGDGKIYVFDVSDAVRISTGERGDSAI